jgi:hypothetical protein
MSNFPESIMSILNNVLIQFKFLGRMGIIYQAIIRSHVVKDTGKVPTDPWSAKDEIEAEVYLKEVKENCLETHHELYVDAMNRRNLHIMNYPIHPKVCTV